MREQYSDMDDRQWWLSLDDRRLIVPWCDDCDRSWLRMTPTCPRCGGSNWSARPISHLGKLYSWVRVHKALDDEFIGSEPYTVGVVELEGGARIYARIIECDVALEPNQEIHLEIEEEGGPSILPFGHVHHRASTR